MVKAVAELSVTAMFISVASALILSREMSPTFVILPSEASNEPPAIAPAPTSMEVKLEVMEPASSAQNLPSSRTASARTVS